MFNRKTIHFCLFIIYVGDFSSIFLPAANCEEVVTADNKNTIEVISNENVTLQCLKNEVPTSSITWKINSEELTTNDRISKQSDGSLLITNVRQSDAGEYTCLVDNTDKQNGIVHQLTVKAIPHPPEVSLFATTTDSITITLTPEETDKENIESYTVHYRPQFETWQEHVAANIDKYTIKDLLCGTNYEIYVTASNSLVNSDPSNKLNVKTKGTKPIIPTPNDFLEMSSRAAFLHLNRWSDGGCPMLYFVIEYKEKSSPEWIVNNNLSPDTKKVMIENLEPAHWYHLRVVAHNTAGFSVGEFEFATLTEKPPGP